VNIPLHLWMSCRPPYSRNASFSFSGLLYDHISSNWQFPQTRLSQEPLSCGYNPFHIGNRPSLLNSLSWSRVFRDLHGLHPILSAYTRHSLIMHLSPRFNGASRPLEWNFQSDVLQAAVDSNHQSALVPIRLTFEDAPCGSNVQKVSQGRQRAKRAPFRDCLREETAQTRRIGSCIRCKMQRIRVSASCQLRGVSVVSKVSC
jgi:hypothetical protein